MRACDGNRSPFCLKSRSLNSPRPRFSVLVPTWNNLPYLKICVRALRQNSTLDFQLVVHVNEGKDGTIEWLNSEGIEFTLSEGNIGICKALNAAFREARGEYIIYLNDDMYVLPDWDRELMKAAGENGSHAYYSATMMERIPGNECAIAPFDYGDPDHHFRESELLQDFRNPAKPDWNGASWPPSMVHRDLWEAVGGYSEEFSPGFYSDPDFSMKLWQQGVRIFRGVGSSRVYHFRSKSLKRVRLNNGRKQFMKKYGISAGYFYKKYLKMGTSFKGSLPEAVKGSAYWLARLKALLS